MLRAPQTVRRAPRRVAAYEWAVLAHVVSAFAFLFTHGAGAFAMFRLKRAKELGEVRALLDVSRLSFGWMQGFNGAVLVTGVTLGFLGDWWGMRWIWIALALYVAIAAAMGGLGTRKYNDLRKAAGQPWDKGMKKQAPLPPDEAEALRLAAGLRPGIAAAVGTVGTVAIIWLMLTKPF